MRSPDKIDKPHHIKWIEAERALVLNLWHSNYYPNQIRTSPQIKRRFKEVPDFPTKSILKH